MNKFIQLQCKTMISSVLVFLQACKLAAKKDDGCISKEEQKTLDALQAAADSFIRELNRVLIDNAEHRWH